MRRAIYGRFVCCKILWAKLLCYIMRKSFTPFERLRIVLSSIPDSTPKGVLDALVAARTFDSKLYWRPDNQLPLEVLRTNSTYERKFWGILGSDWLKLNLIFADDPARYFACLSKIPNSDIIRLLLGELMSEHGWFNDEKFVGEFFSELPLSHTDGKLTGDVLIFELCHILGEFLPLASFAFPEKRINVVLNREDGVFFALGCLIVLADILSWDYKDTRRLVMKDGTYRRCRREARRFVRMLRGYSATDVRSCLYALYGLTDDVIDKLMSAMRDLGREPDRRGVFEMLLLEYVITGGVRDEEIKCLLPLSLAAPGRFGFGYSATFDSLSLKLATDIIMQELHPCDLWTELRKSFSAAFYRYRMRSGDLGRIQMVEMAYLNLGFAVWARLSDEHRNSEARQILWLLHEDEVSFYFGRHFPGGQLGKWLVRLFYINFVTLAPREIGVRTRNFLFGN